MTSDAKIGLLLGLVFIFIIAFIINGLPGFHNDSNNNELTTSMVGSQNNPLGLAAKERKIREVFNRTEPIKEQPLRVQLPPTGNHDIRFKAPLPKSTSVAKETGKTIEINTPTSPEPPGPIITEKKVVETVVKPTPPKIYVVGEGDNLTVIAKKFYGSRDGGKRVNVARIFEANRRFLKSPDELYVGQRLIIPPLSAPAPDEAKVGSLLATPMLPKAKAIDKKVSSPEPPKEKQGKYYVVQEGDSLWRIAAEQLGNASRYDEIAAINADILRDEDSLVVGMRLKMPVR